MPQNGMNYDGRRRGTRRNTCQVNGQVQGTDLVNGAVVHNGCPAAATRTGEGAPAGSPNGSKPQCAVNGYINHGYKGKSTTAAPPRTQRERGRAISAVTDASAAVRVRRAGPPGGIPVNGATSLDTVAWPCNSDQVAPEPRLAAAAAKTQIRWKKCRRQKRGSDITFPPMPPQEHEDWESEIQEVTLTDWETMCFGVSPYGPEDVLPFALRGLTLARTDAIDPPVTANYSPARRHARPVRWSCYSIPTEPDQFADADE